MQSKTAAGMTLVEVVVGATILGIMAFMVSSLGIMGTEAQQYAGRLTRATEMNQDILDDLRLELVSSVTLYSNDAIGLAHIGVLDLSAAPPAVGTVRLPTIDATGSFEKDTAGSEKTGNALFFARHAWTDEYRCVSGNKYRVDLYRWYTYYLAVNGSGPRLGSPLGLNLVKVVSAPMVDGSQVDKIVDDNDRAELLLHLHDQTGDVFGVSHPKAVVVWNRGDDPTAAGTFRQIDPDDGSMSDTPLGSRPNPWRVLPAPKLSKLDMLSYRQHSVSTNFARRVMGVGRFGIVDNTGDGFPHGFEVQIVGPSSSRQVLLHLGIVSDNRRGQKGWSDIQVVIDVRDL